MADPGWDLNDVASSPQSRCAFCLQPVTDAPRTVCGRCHAIYHPDCWAANDARCAVYGCVPAPPPEPPRRRRRFVPAAPVPALAGTGGGSSWRFLVIPLAVIAANAVRFSSHSSSYDPPRPAFHYEIARPPVEHSTEEQAIQRARRFLDLLEDSQTPPPGSAASSALRHEADTVTDALHRARSKYVLSSIETDASRERLKLLNDLIERLQRIRVELERP